MTIPVLDGITAKTITSKRLTTRVLLSGPEDGIPILFLHGNLSSATWWEEVMVSLPEGYRGIAPDQRGFGDADEAKKIDATRGMGDLSDDAVALLDRLGIEKAHIVGNSLGGVVVWRMLIDFPERFISAILPGPGSPYGFRATKDEDGNPCYDDFAGASGSLVNPDMIKSLEEQDWSMDNPMSLRSALRILVFKPPFVPKREKEIVGASMSVHLGPQDMPGDGVPSKNWPYFSAGKWGSVNALSPKYAVNVQDLYNATPKVNILWIRGEDDIAISDSAVNDPANLGKQGLMPDYPGEDVFPPQPMLQQTRKVLDNYTKNGDAMYKEVVIEDCGHAPFLEKVPEFTKAMMDFIMAEDEKAGTKK